MECSLNFIVEDCIGLLSFNVFSSDFYEYIRSFDSKLFVSSDLTFGWMLVLAFLYEEWSYAASAYNPLNLWGPYPSAIQFPHTTCPPMFTMAKALLKLYTCMDFRIDRVLYFLPVINPTVHITRVGAKCNQSPTEDGVWYEQFWLSNCCPHLREIR